MNKNLHKVLFVMLLFSFCAYCQAIEKVDNAAYKKKITSPSFPFDSSLSKMVDADPQTAWEGCEDFSFPLIIEIDFEGYYLLSRIEFISGKSHLALTPDDRKKAAGFYAVKNFLFQYWDDANWTDIPNTERHENRSDSIIVPLSNKILTSKIRLISKDGESMPIREIAAFGERRGESFSRHQERTELKEDADLYKKTDVTIYPHSIGQTMQYVGYNQGHYLPGSNISGWLEYSGVNSLRVWCNLSDYIPKKYVEEDSNIQTLSDFEREKQILRHDPLHAQIQWDSIGKSFSTLFTKASNKTDLSYALAEAKRLEIDPVLQINNRDFNDSWTNKWMQWQRFYALAFMVAKEWDVTRFAIQNEPNHVHSGPMKIQDWISAMQIASDALRCAIEDANRIYDKKLKAFFIGPVTAGVNTNWWAAVMQKIKTNYKGETLSEDQIDLFSTHSYNLPALGYSSKVKDIERVMEENHPEGKTIPICFTEIGRWMNAYLIDKEETMDSPSLCAQWGGIYAHNTLNGAYGMWAFKMSNTSTPVYKRGVKSGHHLIWDGYRFVEAACHNLALLGRVRTSIAASAEETAKITDGDQSDSSAFVFPPSSEAKWIELEMAKTEQIGAVSIYTGESFGIYTAPDRVVDIQISYWSGEDWLPISEAVDKENKYGQAFFRLKKPISTKKIRFLTSDVKEVKVREIKIFSYAETAKLAPSTDITSILKAGHVVRLFAKGFKNQKPLLRTEYDDPDLDVCTSFDSLDNKYYLWVVNRSANNKNMTLNIEHLPFKRGYMIGERVDAYWRGQVYTSSSIGRKKQKLSLSPLSVTLYTITPSDEKKVIRPDNSYYIRGGELSQQSFLSSRQLEIELNSMIGSRNAISYITYPFVLESKPRAAVLEIKGSVFSVAPSKQIKVTVYAYSTAQENLPPTWQAAPYLQSYIDPVLSSVGQDVKIVGEILFSTKTQKHQLDLTPVLKNFIGKNITFCFVRQIAHMGDQGDGGAKVVLDKESKLNLYY